MTRVAVHLVVSGIHPALGETLSSLAEQSGVHLRLRVADLAAPAETMQLVRQWFPDALVLRHVRHLGSAIAEQRLWQVHEASPDPEPFVLWVSPNVLCTTELVQTLVRYLEAHSDVDAVGPLLLKLFDENTLDEALHERVASDLVDSTGLVRDAVAFLADRDAGRLVEHVTTTSGPVFGLRREVVLVRTNVLKTLDQPLFPATVAEHVMAAEFAWRMERAGRRMSFVRDAVAYVHRGVFRPHTAHRRLEWASLCGDGLGEQVRLVCRHVSFWRRLALMGIWVPVWLVRRMRARRSS